MDHMFDTIAYAFRLRSISRYEQMTMWMCYESFSSRAVAHDPLIHSSTFISYLFSFFLLYFVAMNWKQFSSSHRHDIGGDKVYHPLSRWRIFLHFSENEAENKISFNLEIFSSSTTTTFVGRKRKKRREKSRIFLLVNCVKKKFVSRNWFLQRDSFFVLILLSRSFLYSFVHKRNLATSLSSRDSYEREEKIDDEFLFSSQKKCISHLLFDRSMSLSWGISELILRPFRNLNALVLQHIPLGLEMSSSHIWNWKREKNKTFPFITRPLTLQPPSHYSFNEEEIEFLNLAVH